MRSWTLLVAGALTFAMARTTAASCDAPVVSPCVDSDTLWPHAGPSQFIGLGGTETVQAQRISAGLVTTYLSRPIVLLPPSPGSAGSARPAIDNQIDATFLFAYGLTSRLELDLALPVTVFQDGEGTSPLLGSGNNVPTTATRDLRFGATYTILQHPKKSPWRKDAGGLGLAARFETVAPTGDDNAFASSGRATFAPSVAVDYRAPIVRAARSIYAGLEVGARIRPVNDFAGSRIGTQGVIAAAVGVDVLPRELLTASVEVRFLPVFDYQAVVTQTVNGLQSAIPPNPSLITPAEWMVSARSAPLAGGDITLQLGIGGWLPTADFAPITAPRFRIALGFTFAPRGRDTDGDGIPDAEDKCPLERGTKSSEGGAGCP